jgi:hypothetical protein
LIIEQSFKAWISEQPNPFIKHGPSTVVHRSLQHLATSKRSTATNSTKRQQFPTTEQEPYSDIHSFDTTPSDEHHLRTHDTCHQEQVQVDPQRPPSSSPMETHAETKEHCKTFALLPPYKFARPTSHANATMPLHVYALSLSSFSETRYSPPRHSPVHNEKTYLNIIELDLKLVVITDNNVVPVAVDGDCVT